MKKFLAYLLAIAVMMLCTACFDGGENSTIIATQNKQEPTLSQDEPTHPTTAPTSGTAVTPTESSTNPSTEPTQPDEITLAETVIYDDKGVKITVKGLTDGWTGPELKVLVENSTDKNIVFSGSEFVVNGVTISGSAYIDVAAGKKTNNTISMYGQDLEEAGIYSIATIQGMDFRVYDSDTYVDMFDVPFALATSIASQFVQEIDDSGDVLSEKAGVTIIAKKLSEDWLGYNVVLFVRNDTGKDVIINAENISVNGFTISGWLYDHVYTDSVRFCEIMISSSSLSENDIKKIESVTFTINIIDPDTYDRIAESDEIGIAVE